jgi:hypothetical protein
VFDSSLKMKRRDCVRSLNQMICGPAGVRSDAEHGPAAGKPVQPQVEHGRLGCTIHVLRTKSEEPRNVPLNDAPLAALRIVHSRNGADARVFLSERTGKPLEQPGIGLNRLCAKQGSAVFTGTASGTCSPAASE